MSRRSTLAIGVLVTVLTAGAGWSAAVVAASTTAAASSCPTSASFSYDALGRRIDRTIAGSSVGFAFDGASAVQDGSPAVRPRTSCWVAWTRPSGGSMAPAPGSSYALSARPSVWSIPVDRSPRATPTSRMGRRAPRAARRPTPPSSPAVRPTAPGSTTTAPATTARASGGSSRRTPRASAPATPTCTATSAATPSTRPTRRARSSSCRVSPGLPSMSR